MTELTAALVQASKTFSEPIAQRYASGNRVYRVRLERPGAHGTFDRESGVWTDPPDAVLYEGPARIFPATGAMELDVGDERVPFSSVVVTLDLFSEATTPAELLGEQPRADDVVRVLNTPQSQQTHLVDRTFEVNGVDVGGHYGVGWTLHAIGAGPHRGG